ncbi:sigma-70 family RNA polymerase sigma factor [Streptomyces sp. URMC 127]|uniref:sigma-70 family RNA polymerase sigma factor n=1 Tax=Streptomyces sp. URMC 127 TaxID=3423402 RepID=UPI003F1BCC16
MNGEDFDDAVPSDLPQQVGALNHLPLDFEAFYLTHGRLYLAYAESHLGNEDQAKELVHQVFLEIKDAWKALLGEGNFEKAAWAVLRQAVGLQLEAEDRRPSFIADGSIARALRASRDQLKIMDSSVGLYTAIADLPPKQFDVIVLRHVLGYSTRDIAWFMGLSESVVDYHHRNGRERLRLQLGLPASERPRKERDTR